MDALRTDIAVIGMSGRFPGSMNIEEYWRNLCNGVESVTFFSPEEIELHLKSLDRSGAEQAAREMRHPDYVQAGYILKDVESFDASFFGYNPSEAELIDPQQRLFLECAWESFENAGYDPHAFGGTVGVFASTGMSRYFMHNIFSNREIWYSERDLLALIGNEVDYLPTRVSYKLNLRGPSISVQSACSSSLAAIHIACQSLLQRECDMALAGGAIVQTPQTHGYMYREGGLLSRDGHCRVFDAKASGTVFSNGGVGCVLLKRLDQALADGDYIYAVVKGSAMNNDGSFKSVMTAPSVDGQVKVFSDALAKAGIDPDTISYVEAHGTGTLLGDPVEMSSLTKVFQASTKRNRFCAVGSVKSNVGHLDRAAGVAGFIKTVLALKRQKLPPSLNFESPNPRIDFENSPFYVNTQLTDWRKNEHPRRAGVNSFGVGGTNAHVILEEAPTVEFSDDGRPWQMLALSARSASALTTVTANLAAHLEAHPDEKLADIAYTLHVGRRAFDQRRILVARDAREALAALKTGDPKRLFTGSPYLADKAVTFMFSGQGAQYVNMGRDLYENENVFREQIDICSSLLEAHLGLDIRQILYPMAGKEEAASDRLTQTSLAQPALFVFEFALARLLMSWGIKPQAMIGHSIGEYVAACLAGVFSLEDAIRLVATRGQLMQTMAVGAMLSVALPEEKLVPLLDSDISLAASNAPAACVVAGPKNSVELLECRLLEQGIHSRRLHTSHAFHSNMMDPILKPFTDAVKRVHLHAPAIPYVSNITGTWITEREVTDPGYWSRHLRSTVRFAGGMQTLLRDGDRVLIEVGPGTTLSTLARQCIAQSSEAAVFSTINHPRDPQPPLAYFLTTLGRLWLSGVEIDWRAFYGHQRRHRLPLPTYPFERQRYWIEPKKEGDSSSLGILGIRSKIDDWFYVPSWKRTLYPALSQSLEEVDNSCYMVFCDDAGIGSRLAKRLHAHGGEVVVVQPGLEFAITNETFVINPGRRDDYDRLLSKLAEREQMPNRIIHLWSITKRTMRSGIASFEKAQETGFYSLLFLAQALGKQNASGPIQITVVSNNLHDVTGEEKLSPEKAPILGPCKVIPLEYPNITCRDVDIVISEKEREAVIDRLIAELRADVSDSVVAHRGKNRWVQIFERVTSPPVENRPALIKQGGVYLITGGLGGIGLVLAEHLARTVQPKLALIARTELPPRRKWDTWLATHENGDPTSRKITKIRSLEELGAKVLVISGNVTDVQHMTSAISKVRKRFGSIDGVIHSAGVPGGGMIQLKTREATERVLAPKAKGSLVLEKVLKNEKLDFFVFCSSLFAITGGIGQIDYCAANNFMDAFARSRRNKATAYVSINWDAWREVGMAVNMLERRKTEKTSFRSTSNKLEHPLLGALFKEETGREVYTTEFSPSKYWILTEHKLLGNSVVPGTAYLEMIRAAFESHAGGGGIEISDVFFMKPLEVGETDLKKIHLILDKDGDGFAFAIRSTSSREQDEHISWDDHVTGKVRTIGLQTGQSLNIEAVRARCNAREISFEDNLPPILDQWEKNGFLVFGPRWKNLKSVHIGKSEALAFLELPQEFLDDVDSYKMHPALLDMATGVASAYIISVAGDEQNNDLYLPLVYKRLRYYAPLPARFYSHISYQSNVSTKNDNLMLNILLVDERGAPLVEIDGFTLRRVPDAVLRSQKFVARENHATNQKSPAKSKNTFRGNAASAAPLTLQGLGSEGILSSEGVDAFTRVLSGNMPSQVVVSTTDLIALMKDIRRLSHSSVEQLSESTVPRATHPRPNVQTPYEAPRNELEKTLSDIWQVVLGIDKVGVHDNFFELGADSVLGVQVISKARNMGIMLSPSQLFEYQTVAELATVAAKTTALLSEGPDHGPVPFTPYQHLLLEQGAAESRIFRKAFLVELKEPLDSGIWEQAVGAVLTHHDALRLRYTFDASGWRQEMVSPDEEAPFTRIDLSGVPESEQTVSLEASVSNLQASLNLTKGPILKVALVNMGTQKAARLLVVMHPLVADEASLRILLEDLQAVSLQLSRGESIQFSQKTASFRQWAERLEEYAQSGEARQELDYWLSAPRAQARRLPQDHPDGTNTEASYCTVSVVLSEEDTHALLREVPKAYNTEMNDVLITALAQAFSRWTGDHTLFVELRGDGRAGFFTDMDFSHTLGQFSTVFPMLITLSGTSKLGETLKSIKEQLRGVPGQGVGYGVLRYLADDAVSAKLRSLPQAEVSFNFLDHRNQLASEPALVGPIREINSPLLPSRGRRPYLLAIQSAVVSGQLRVEVHYNENIHQRATVERVAGYFTNTLHDLIAHCLSPEAGGYTPSDFPNAELDQKTLDTFIGSLDKL